MENNTFQLKMLGKSLVMLTDQPIVFRRKHGRRTLWNSDTGEGKVFQNVGELLDDTILAPAGVPWDTWQKPCAGNDSKTRRSIQFLSDAAAPTEISVIPPKCSVLAGPHNPTTYRRRDELQVRTGIGGVFIFLLNNYTMMKALPGTC